MTVKDMGIAHKGEMKPCEDCALAKIGQKKTNKTDPNRSTVTGERLHIDISYVTTKSLGGDQYWLLVVDQASGFKWTRFLKSKDELADEMINLIREIKGDGKNPKYIRLDNAGENLNLSEKLVKNDIYNIDIEYTAPATPPHNGIVERSFGTLYSKVRAMLNVAKLSPSMRQKIWSECCHVATNLDNLCVKKENTKSSFEKYHGKQRKIIMKCFGELGVIKYGSKMQSKTKNRGATAMMLGYAANHSQHTYRFLNLKTMNVCHSRDVIWLNRMWGDKYKVKPAQEVNDDDEPVDCM